jgi:hypothetical protein
MDQERCSGGSVGFSISPKTEEELLMTFGSKWTFGIPVCEVYKFPLLKGMILSFQTLFLTRNDGSKCGMFYLL